MERDYYVVESQKVVECLESIMAHARSVREIRIAGYEGLGAVGTWGSDRAVVGLMWRKNKAIPEGWAQDKKAHTSTNIVIKPNRKTKTGKDAAKLPLFTSGPLWDLNPFYQLVKISYIPVYENGQMMLANPRPEKVGDKWVVSVPKRGATPRGERPSWRKPKWLRRLKTSEYYIMKEAA